MHSLDLRLSFIYAYNNVHNAFLISCMIGISADCTLLIVLAKALMGVPQTDVTPRTLCGIFSAFELKKCVGKFSGNLVL